jgi:hypothetical protein
MLDQPSNASPCDQFHTYLAMEPVYPQASLMAMKEALKFRATSNQTAFFINFAEDPPGLDQVSLVIWFYG